MKFVLFVEGKTEQKAIPAFLKRWLDPRLTQAVGVRPVKFEGWAELLKDAPKKAELHLSSSDVIAVISLLDLYGPTIYPNHATTVQQRLTWAKDKIEGTVGLSDFAQFFAVHEVEAWLLSDPPLFPTVVRNSFPSSVNDPETVNFNTPPAKMLDDLYARATRRHYKKVSYGKSLFSTLDPEAAYVKCPNLKLLLDEMLTRARAVGL